jgi:hypothetical protein
MSREAMSREAGTFSDPPILQRAAGVIIGSSLKQGGVWWKAVDAERVKAFSQVVARELDQMEDRRAG